VKAGDLVRYKRQDRAMVGMIVKIHVNKLRLSCGAMGSAANASLPFLR